MNALSIKIAVLAAICVVLAFGLWRLYDIGGDRREKSIRLEWTLDNAQKTKETEKDRVAKQIEIDKSDAHAQAEIQKYKALANTYAGKYSDEIKKSIYRTKLPDSGRVLYNETVHPSKSD